MVSPSMLYAKYHLLVLAISVNMVYLLGNDIIQLLGCHVVREFHISSLTIIIDH